MSVRPLFGSSIPEPRAAAAQRSASPRAWMIAACLLLGISGGIRFWRDWQFRAVAHAGAVSPFPLKELPLELGSWTTVQGSQSQLDPQVARIAGSSDHIIREYENKNNKDNERLSVLVLYGLGTAVFGHTPEVCYPSNGYRLVMGPVEHRISVPGVANPVRCRLAIYSKRMGTVERYEESCYTFFHNGQWLPNLADRWKSFRYHPGVFKIQVQRTVTRLATDESPSEDLIGQFAQEIERRMAHPDVSRHRQGEPTAPAPGVSG